MTAILKAVESTRETIEQVHVARIGKLDEIKTLAEELAELDEIIAGERSADPPVQRKPKKRKAVKRSKPESGGIRELNRIAVEEDLLRVVAAAYPDGVGRGHVVAELAGKGYPDWKITRGLKQLVEAGQLVTEGRSRGTKYLIAQGATAETPTGGGRLTCRMCRNDSRRSASSGRAGHAEAADQSDGPGTQSGRRRAQRPDRRRQGPQGSRARISPPLRPRRGQRGARLTIR
jgi:hypothetical protein